MAAKRRELVISTVAQHQVGVNRFPPRDILMLALQKRSLNLVPWLDCLVRSSSGRGGARRSRSGLVPFMGM